MPRQTGPISVSGTINGVTYYQLNGKRYLRKKSSLNRKQIKTAKNFARTRVLNDKMKLASPTASSYYQSLSQGKKEIKRYRKMVAVAQHLLAEGKTIEEVHVVLKKMRDDYENI